MEHPTSLPAKLYLLAYDEGKQRLTARSQLGNVLRAGALADLTIGGYLGEEAGRPTVVRTDHHPDPVVDSVLQEIAGDKSRPWHVWVRRASRAMRRAVQQQLADARVIGVEPRRFLGIFPYQRITVLDPLIVARLRGSASRTLLGGQPVGGIEPQDVAVVALTVAGEVRIVVSRRQAREHKSRIAELSAATGPPAPALRKVLRERRAAAAAGG